MWTTRVQAACQQHNLTFETFKNALQKCNIVLNNKVLSELAVWEPRSFKSLTDIAYQRAVNDGFNSINDLGTKNNGIITRGMLKSKINSD